MSLRDRIGIDLGRKIRLEEGIEWAARNDVRYIDIQLDTHDNAMPTIDERRAAGIRAACEKHGVHLGLHTLSAVNVAEYSPYVSDAVDLYLRSYIDIYGSHGTVRVGWKESRYRQAGSSDWVVFGAGYDKVQAFRRQIDNFCRALRGRETLLINAEDAIASVEVIEAAYESLHASRWFPVHHQLPADSGREAAGEEDLLGVALPA